MQLYILTEDLRRDAVVESYQSLIWTDRYSAFGDFQLDIEPSKADPSLYSQGTYLASDVSDRVMYVDNVERETKQDGNKVLTIKGKSLEAILDDRPNKYDDIVSGGVATTLILGPGLPADLIRTLVDAICRTNTAYGGVDNIPYLQSGHHSAVPTLPEPSDPVTIQSETDTLYNTIKTIADTYHLGFRLVRVEQADTTQHANLYFEVYTGYDRTSDQTALDAVVFSEEFGNLTNTNELTSTAALKNVAFVFSPAGSRVVYDDAVDPTVAGFKKRVLIVNATDITDLTGTALNNALDQRGREELTKTRLLIGFDGEIPQTGSYVYGVDYMLGDIVEQRDSFGVVRHMRVTEQIFVSDTTGAKSYPTLTIDTVVTPGSWDAVAPNEYWDDIAPTVYWDNL